jgi:hypothetical protein
MLTCACSEAAESAPRADAGERVDASEATLSPKAADASAPEPAADGGDASALATADAGVAESLQDAGSIGPEPEPDGPEILTQRYDNGRTGANLNERVLSPDKVRDLSLIGSWSVEAEIYAQVLVAAGVEIAGTKHAVAIVATMNNTLYAFDADAVPADAFLWHQGLRGELGLPAFCARNIGGPNGILSTHLMRRGWRAWRGSHCMWESGLPMKNRKAEHTRRPACSGRVCGDVG